jgi:hypothetical protein
MYTPPRQRNNVVVPNAPPRINRYNNIPNAVLNRLAVVYNNNINLLNNNEANVIRVIDNLGQIVRDIDNVPVIRRLNFNNFDNNNLNG